MAHLHNNAGQWGKQQAAHRFVWFFTAAMLFMSAICFLAGFFLSRRMTIVAFALFVTGALACWILLKRLLEPMLDRMNRARIKYLRGAQAEGLIAWLLKDLDDNWHVFNNLQLDDAGDLDHVVVGPGGVWCISTKSMRGLLTLSADGKLLHNLQPVNWLNATMGQTMRLRDRLEALMGKDVPWITAMLAVPFVYVDLRSPAQNVHVCHQDEMLSRIDDAPKRLDKQQVARVTGAMTLLAESAKHVYKLPSRSEAGAWAERSQD